MELTQHHNALLQRGRCGRCAELAPASVILRAESCPSCGNALQWRADDQCEDLLDGMRARWRDRMWMILTSMMAASFFAGQVPMLQSGVAVLGLVALHLSLIRTPLLWLPRARRASARLTVKLLGVVLALLNLVVNLAVAPFVVVNGAVLAALGALNLFLFVHLSMKIIEKRLRWERDGVPFGVQDWVVPAVVGGFLLALALMTGVFLGAIWWVMTEIYTWFMSLDVLDWLLG